MRSHRGGARADAEDAPAGTSAGAEGAVDGAAEEELAPPAKASEVPVPALAPGPLPQAEELDPLAEVPEKLAPPGPPGSCARRWANADEAKAVWRAMVAAAVPTPAPDSAAAPAWLGTAASPRDSPQQPLCLYELERRLKLVEEEDEDGKATSGKSSCKPAPVA